MKGLAWGLLLGVAVPVGAQAADSGTDPWQGLHFLEGTWEARTGTGASAQVVGTYVFARELKGHVLARHGTVAGCTGPESFDCQHTDQLTVFQDRAGAPLRADYFDNEGHVIHYGVSVMNPATVEFLSEPAPGPRFRLVYHLEGGVMFGKFQMQMPGQESWRSYLEWSGKKV